MSASAPGSDPRGGVVRPLRPVPRSRAYWELKAEQMMNRIFDPEEPIDLAVEPEVAALASSGPSAAAPSLVPPARTGLSQAPGPAAASSFAAARAAAVAAASASLSGAAPAPVPASSTAAVPLLARPVAPPRPPASRQTRRTPAPRPAAPEAAAVPRQGWLRRPDERLLLIGALCGVCVASVAGSLLYLGHWSRLQQNIAQERNLLLMERLRSLGPANPSPAPGLQPAAPVLPSPADASAAGVEGLPPPPPQEAWIEQLSSLPSTAPPRSPRVLTVPVSPRLAAPSTPPAAARGGASAANRPASSPAPARPAAPLPQLVGVVAGAGRAPSAIFLVAGSSMSVASGELIGSTGWRLRSADGETALIERGGELRQVSIASGNGF